MPVKDISTAARVSARLPELTDTLGNDEFILLARYLPTLCWIARADGYIAWYNDRWHTYCGTTPDAMAGWGWQSVHDPEVLPEVLHKWKAAIADEKPFEMVFPIRAANGVFHPFLTRITPLRDASGQVVRWYGVNSEITAQIEAEQALVISSNLYRTLTDVMPQMVWSTLPDGFHDYYNAQWYKFTGVPAGSTDGEAWNGMFHPEDQDRAWERWRHSLATGENYEIEYRLRHHTGSYRWTLGRAQPVLNSEGKIIRWIGTCTDIHDAKIAAEQNKLLNHELSHRIKNIFSIIGGLIALSSRHDPASKEFAKGLSQRITALSRAHNLTQIHSDQSGPDLSLTTLLETLFSPYAIRDQARIFVSGDSVSVDERVATPFALLFHELATNAAKYGALLNNDGRVDVTLRQSGDSLEIIWAERGGPELSGPPAAEGFGTRLAALSVEQQLGGSLVREWRREGLRVTAKVKLPQLMQP